MIRSHPDRLFDRFRRTGDPRLLAQVFDATAPELWRVAAHLCRDTHAAEDAVQGSFLTALEARASWDAQRPLLPWLLGHLANRVREQRRAAARVPDAARLARPGERDPADVAADREVEGTLQSALARLDEPYRSTLERHLVHGLAAPEIAAELAVPAGTVRMRLHRGLDRLRQKLPPGLAVSGAAVLPLRPEVLATMRAKVLGAVPGGAAVVGSGHAASFVIGVFLMSKVFWTVLVSGVVLLSAWWAWPAASAVEPSSSERVAAAEPARPQGSVPPPADEPANAAASNAGPERVVIESAAPAGTKGWVRVVLRNAGNGAPVPGADLEVRDGLRERPPEAGPGPAVTSREDAAHTFSTDSDADGVCTLHLQPGWASLSLPDLGVRRSLEVTPGGEQELRLDLPVRFTSDVRVVDADDRPVPGARLIGSTSFDRGLAARDLGRTDADGRFAAPFVETKVTLRAVHEAYAASAAVPLDPRNPTARLRLGSAPATIAGTVFGPDGAPLANSDVALQPQPRARRDMAPLLTRTDAGGHFECTNVPAGRCLVVAVRLLQDGQSRLAETAVDAIAQQRTMVEVRFDQTASLDVHIALVDGTPVADQRGMLWLQREAFAPVLADRGTAMFATGADGRATVRDLLPGRYRVEFSHAQGLVQQFVDLAPGATQPFEHVFGGRPGLDVRVLDTAGRPLVGWTVTLVSGTVGRREVTDGDGRVRFRDMATATGQLRVQADETVPAADLREVQRGAQIEVRVDTANVGQASLRGVLVPPAESRVDQLHVLLVRKGEDTDAPALPIDVAVDPTTGAFEARHLTAGSYGLYVFAGKQFDAPLAMREPIEVAAAGCVDLGRIVAGTGRLEVRATFADGRACAEARLAVGSAGSRVFVDPPGTNDSASAVLPEGSYVALVWGEAIAPVATTANLQNGATTELPVVVQAAARVTVSFAAIETSDFGRLTVRPSGQSPFELALGLHQVFERGFPAGSHELELDDLHGHRFRASFTVGSDLAPREVTLQPVR